MTAAACFAYCVYYTWSALDRWVLWVVGGWEVGAGDCVGAGFVGRCGGGCGVEGGGGEVGGWRGGGNALHNARGSGSPVLCSLGPPASWRGPGRLERFSNSKGDSVPPSAIKLKRTETTLDLSQKAEKGMMAQARLGALVPGLGPPGPGCLMGLPRRSLPSPLWPFGLYFFNASSFILQFAHVLRFSTCLCFVDPPARAHEPSDGGR